MRKFLVLLSVMLMLCSCEHDRYLAFRGFAQGGTYTVKVNMKGVKKSPKEVSAAIDSILARIDSTLSGYNACSCVSRLNSGLTIRANDIFAEVYNISRELFDETGGAFNVAASPLFDIWGFGFTSGEELPPQEKIDSALALSDMSSMPLRLAEGDSLKDVRLNFNAIAQGYSCDLVARYLYGIGVHDMLVDIGEIFLDGHNPSGLPWSIAIDKPVDGNMTPGAQIDSVISRGGAPQGVVTSGNYRKFYIRDGRKYSHTIDPRDGYPVRHQLLSATVIAPNATLADAYATYCMVIGPDAAREFLDSRDDLEGVLITAP